MSRQTKLMIFLLLVWTLVAWPAAAQKAVGYSDAYCAGFVTQRPMDSLNVVAGEEKEDRFSYTTPQYAYLSQGGLAVGSEYMIVRRAVDRTKAKSFNGQRLLQNAMGLIYDDIARVKVVVAHPKVSTAQVIFSCAEILPGDLAISPETRPTPEYRARRPFDRFAPPSGKTVAQVVNARDFQQFPGIGQHIYVNLGSSEVKPGDYLRIFRMGKGPEYRATGRGAVYEMPRRVINKGDLPREVIGEAMVIRVEDHAAVAIVTESLREISLGDYLEPE